MTYEEVRHTISVLSAIEVGGTCPTFIPNEFMVERVLYARSPARAKRREKKGFPQNYITQPMKKAVTIDGCTYFAHPQFIHIFEEAVRRDRENA